MSLRRRSPFLARLRHSEPLVTKKGIRTSSDPIRSVDAVYLARYLRRSSRGAPMLPIMTDEARDLAHWEAAEEGAELIRDGEHPLAVHELLRQLEGDPSNAYAYYFLGTAFFEMGELLKALKAYLQALALKPDYLGALNGAA